MHTHTCTPAPMYAYTSTHTRTWMYACTHASTTGTTAPQRQGEELMQTPEASHISPVQCNQPHLASPMLGLHCTHFLRPQYPSTPRASPLPNIPQDSSRTTASVVSLPNIDSSPECTSRVDSLRALTTLAKRSMKNDQNPATAHHIITTARRPDNIRSSILLRGQSIRSMAPSGRRPRRPLP